MALPSVTEQCDLMVQARAQAPADRAQLVWALAEFMRLTMPYVSAGMSAPAMVDAYNLGLAALRGVIEEADQPDQAVG